MISIIKFWLLFIIHEFFKSFGLIKTVFQSDYNVKRRTFLKKMRERWQKLLFFFSRSSYRYTCYEARGIAENGSYMKRSHARTLQLSSKLSGYVLYTVLYAAYY